MECNELPKLDLVGTGVERRIRAIPFTSRFVSKAAYDLLEDKTGFGIADPKYKTDTFKNEHRQALFHILIEHWTKFQANGYMMSPAPESCKKLTVDYLACSDDIYGWFLEKYEKGDCNKDMILVDDLYKKFTNSDLWENMSKNDKRTNNAKKFVEKVEKNIFLSSAFKPARSYFNGTRVTKPFLVGYKRVTPDVLPTDTDDGITDDDMTEEY